MITVIINCYKRLNYLDEQIKAIENQTVKPDKIIIWYNKPENEDFQKIETTHDVVYSTNNYKFHGRFSIGLLAKTEYVAFFDDDTIPGTKWFENCLNTMKHVGDGILGTTGIHLNANDYGMHTKIGWNGVKNPQIRKVDLVGHAWFLRKKNIKYLFYEEPQTWENGEDIQLSYLAFKYSNVETFVPPHPNNDDSFWGSKQNTGQKYGTDEHASYKKSSHILFRNSIVSNYLKDGWKTVRHRK